MKNLMASELEKDSSHEEDADSDGEMGKYLKLKIGMDEKRKDSLLEEKEQKQKHQTHLNLFE